MIIIALIFGKYYNHSKDTVPKRCTIRNIICGTSIGEPIFAFGNAPAYKQRKTRNLGNSRIIGFQPRKIFKGLEGTEKGGIMSREKVRARVEKWDQLPKHPDISHFGDPDHNEWKQFFIGDDSEPIKGSCPFHHKSQ